MTNLGPLGLNLMISAVVAVGVLLVAFVAGSLSGHHRVVDIFWGLGFTAVALTTYVLSAGHGDSVVRAVATSLTAIWGVRLTIHIAWRSRGKGEDPRYEQLLRKGRGNPHLYALRAVYLLQAVVLWFVSLPIQFAQYGPGPAGWWIAVSASVWAIGFFFEAVGDAQLVRFSADPASRSAVLDSGLWRYTRHPNYFGDAVVWWGLYGLACGTPLGVLTVVSPLAMNWFLLRKTGKPLMEAHLSNSRQGYADYVCRTSGFVPRLPRRAEQP